MAVLLIALAVAAVVAAVAAIAVAQRRRQAVDNEVVPGRPTRAPRSWAGAHTPEARLHRRLRDAVRALGGLGGVDAVTRAEVERHVADLDDRLVAVASLPQDQRTVPLEVLAEQVAAVEAAVGAFATDGLDGSTDATAGLAALSDRLDALAAAHAELDALERRTDPSMPTGPGAAHPTADPQDAVEVQPSPASPADLDALADRLDTEREARTSVEGQSPTPPASVEGQSPTPPAPAEGAPDEAAGRVPRPQPGTG